MTRKLLVFASLVVVCASLAACGHSPTSPSTTTPTQPPPDQSKYEPLPTAQHLLLDASGATTNMWAQLRTVTPLRGSFITLGPGADNRCTGCFQWELIGGLINVPNPNTRAGFTVGFSQDGVTMTTRLDAFVSTTGSTGASGQNGRVQPFNEVPKYLLVQASYPGDTCDPRYVNPCYGTFPGQNGSYAFLLDYQSK